MLLVDVFVVDVCVVLVEGVGVLFELVCLVDDYCGEGVVEGLKSLMFVLCFCVDDCMFIVVEVFEVKFVGVVVVVECFGVVIWE